MGTVDDVRAALRCVAHCEIKRAGLTTHGPRRLRSANICFGLGHRECSQEVRYFKFDGAWGFVLEMKVLRAKRITVFGVVLKEKVAENPSRLQPR